MTIDNPVDRKVDSLPVSEVGKLEVAPKEGDSKELELQQRWEEIGGTAEAVSRDLKVYFSEYSDSLGAINSGLSHLLESGVMPRNSRVNFGIQDSFDSFRQNVGELQAFSSEMSNLVDFYSSTSPEDFSENGQDIIAKLDDLESRLNNIYTIWFSKIESMEGALVSLKTVAEQNYDLLGGDAVEEIHMTSSRIFAGIEETKTGLSTLQKHFYGMKDFVVDFLQVSTEKK